MPKSNCCNIDEVFTDKNIILMLLKLSLMFSGWHPALSMKRIIFQDLALSYAINLICATQIEVFLLSSMPLVG